MDRASQWIREGQFRDPTAGSSLTESDPVSPLEQPAPVVTADGVRPFTPDQRHPHHARSEPALRDSQTHQRNLSVHRQPRPRKSESSIRFSDSANVHDHRRHHSRQRSVPGPYHRHNPSSSATLQPLSGWSTRDTSTTDLRPVASSTESEHRRRMMTNLGEPEDAPIEVRHTHDYFFRRPRPLLVEHRGHVLAVGEHEKLDIENPENSYHLDVRSNGRSSHSKEHEHHPDSLHKQRERLDIFVDLIWVGIIANIASHFHARVFTREDNVGVALGEFILLFLPAWRIWISLQSWLNSYYTDDYFQRIFVVWILILGVVWGNNAPYLLADLSASNLENWTIITFIVAMASFAIMQGIYAHWLPWLRRYMLVSWVTSIPGIALWIAAATVPAGPLKYGFVSGAIGYSALEFVFLSTPWADRLLGNGIRKAQDSRTMIHRYENFFIIALGEGVFLIIRNSPLVAPDAGFVSVHLGRGVLVLLLFYIFNWVYFHGDMSKRYIHAMDRRWWIKFLWQMAHIPLFAALVILSSGTLFLVMFPVNGTSSSYNYPYYFLPYDTTYKRSMNPTNDAALAHSTLVSRAASPNQVYNEHTLQVGTIVTCVCVSVSLASQLVLALLNRPVDDKRTLRVSNPYLRMLPRAFATVVMAVVWLAPGINEPTAVLGLSLGVVLAVALLEQLLGMPVEARIFEPKEAGVRSVMSGRYESRGSSQTRF